MRDVSQVKMQRQERSALKVRTLNELCIGEESGRNERMKERESKGERERKTEKEEEETGRERGRMRSGTDWLPFVVYSSFMTQTGPSFSFLLLIPIE